MSPFCHGCVPYGQAHAGHLTPIKLNMCLLNRDASVDSLCELFISEWTKTLILYEKVSW